MCRPSALLSDTRNRLPSAVDSTQIGKVTELTSAKRPSVKYFSRDDFPTVESPMRMSLEVEERLGVSDSSLLVVVQLLPVNYLCKYLRNRRSPKLIIKLHHIHTGVFNGRW